MAQWMSGLRSLVRLMNMTPQQSEVGLAIQLEFVAALSYNPRTHQYRVDLTEPYRSDLPRDRNYLLIDAQGFTVNKLMDVFQREVVDYYELKCDQARQVLAGVRSKL